MNIIAWSLYCYQVIDEDGCQKLSHDVGTYLLTELAKLRDQFENIGDVRGKGLMIGIEMVKDKVIITIAKSILRYFCLYCVPRTIGTILERKIQERPNLDSLPFSISIRWVAGADPGGGGRGARAPPFRKFRYTLL